MPTYEYKCDECDHAFEKFQRMTDEPVKICPQCNRESVRRIISGGSGLLFKGSGFYTTDYRSSDYTEARKKEAGAGGDQKSDTKSGGESKSTGDGSASSNAKPSSGTGKSGADAKTGS